MTAFPDRDAATSLVLIAPLVKRRRIASATAPPSMMAPSTMLSGGTGSLPNAATLNALPAGLSSTALTALEPISRPTRDFALRNTGNVQSCDPTQLVSGESIAALFGGHTDPEFSVVARFPASLGGKRDATALLVINFGRNGQN